MSTNIYDISHLRVNQAQISTLTKAVPLRWTMYSLSQHSRCFWNRYNVAVPCWPEPNSGRTVLTTAVCSVSKLKYPVIWSAHYIWHRMNVERLTQVIPINLVRVVSPPLTVVEHCVA